MAKVNQSMQSSMETLNPAPTLKASAYKGLLNQMPAGLILLDSKGKVQWINQKAYQYFKTNIVNQCWSQVIKKYFNVQQDDGFEVSFLDGRKFSIEISASRWGQIIVLWDCTQSRDYQTKVATEKRLESMGKIAAKLAHQLKTPLATANVYAYQLMTQKSEAPKQKYAQKILKQLHFLEKTINETLSFFKGEQGYVEKSSVEELLKSALESIEDKVDQFQVKKEGHPEAYQKEILVNTVSMVGVFNNLLANAVEASLTRKEIIIQVKTVDNKWVEVQITNWSTPVDGQTLSRVFEPYFTTKSTGTGLGLAVVESVVKAHYGKCWVTSELDGKITFTIQLPFAQTTININ